MIRQILGSARLIIQILLVVAAVVLIYSWNPLNLFGGKAELKPTANMVSEIREIGEMITAEYYGEVLTSLDEVQIDYQNNEQIILQAEYTYDKILEDISQLRYFQSHTPPVQIKIGNPDNQLKAKKLKQLITNKNSKSNIEDRLIFHCDWEQTRTMEFFDEILSYIYLKKNDKEKALTDPLRGNQLRKILLEWLDDPSMDALWDADTFKTDYYASKLSDRPRSEARKKLAMIGRGTVKAGFDFEDLQSHMYYLNEEVGELHIFGLAPKILNADINPWFIPEKGVPGFDLLNYNKKVNFKDSKKVKIYTVQKLKTNALKAGIIEQAELNGGQTISRLVNLLTNVEVKKVIFHHDALIDLTKEIQKDRFISYEEAALFENHLNNELEKIDSLRAVTTDRYNNRKLADTKWSTMEQMLKQLQTYEFESQTLPYNYFSTLWYQVSEDKLIEDKDWETIQGKIDRKTAQEELLKALWVGDDSLLLKSQLNEGLFQILKDSIPIGRYIADSASLVKWNEKSASDTICPLTVTLIVSKDTIIYPHFVVNKKNKQELLHLIGLEKYQPKVWEDWITNKESIRKINKLDTVNALNSEFSEFWLVNKDDPDQLIQVNIPLDQLTYPLLLGLDGKVKSNTNLTIGNHILFLSSNNFKVDLNSSSSTLPNKLSTDQLKALEAHLIKLYTEYDAYHNRDFLTKANRWFSSKMESKSGILDKFKR